MTVQTSITVEMMAEALRKTGYRATTATHEGRPQIRSAAQGLGFSIAFGVPDSEAKERYLDYSFHCWITIEDTLRPGLTETWNQTRRFSRMFQRDNMLVLTMDALVAGGVDENNLCAYCELWDRVIQDFILHLKQEPIKAAG